MSALFAILLIAGVSVVIFLSGNGITGLIAEEPSDFEVLQQQILGTYWNCVYGCRDNWNFCVNDPVNQYRRESCGDIYAACEDRCRKLVRR